MAWPSAFSSGFYHTSPLEYESRAQFINATSPSLSPTLLSYPSHSTTLPASSPTFPVRPAYPQHSSMPFLPSYTQHQPSLSARRVSAPLAITIPPISAGAGFVPYSAPPVPYSAPPTLGSCSVTSSEQPEWAPPPLPQLPLPFDDVQPSHGMGITLAEGWTLPDPIHGASEFALGAEDGVGDGSLPPLCELMGAFNGADAVTNAELPVLPLAVSPWPAYQPPSEPWATDGLV